MGVPPARPEDPATSDPGLYLDAHATTPCDPRVVEAMAPCWRDDLGNPASVQHAWGRRAAERVDIARHHVATTLGVEASEIVFTSGATEADNLALLGAADAWRHRHGSPGHLVTAVTEHKAVLDTAMALERRGVDVTWLGVDADGRVDPAAVADALRDDTFLVSLMVANNEIGVLHPIAEIAEVCRRRGVPIHADAAQALLTEDCRIERLGVDLLSISGHKLYGPPGIGALYVRRRRPRIRLEPQSFGGGHERGRRSGSLPVPLIVGLGIACTLTIERRDTDRTRLAELRDRLLDRLRVAFPRLTVHGSLEHRLPHNLNVALPAVDASLLLDAVRGVAFASGSACTTSSRDGSYVVRALPGVADDAADRALRFGLLRTATAEQIDRAADEVVRAARSVRGHRPTDACALPDDTTPALVASGGSR
ncbi:MAG: cysteine desulfurase family protein [Acidobacteriota bacterium]